MEASPKATDKQKLDFLSNLERLTDPKVKAVAPLRDRLVLARQLIDQSVDITAIDQGGFKTCAMGGVEKLMYSRKLDAVGRMVTDLALTGKTVTDAGVHVDLDSKWLLGGPQGRRMVPPTDGVRSLASHYITMLSANVRIQQFNQENGTQFKYAHENGRDIVKDFKTNPPGDVYQHFEKGDLLTQQGDKNPPPGYFPLSDPMITDATILLNTYEKLSGQSAAGMAIRARQPYRTDPRMIEFGSPQELHDQLAKREERDFPVILVQPGHVSTIDGFDKKTGLADYDNQWGKQNDRIGANGINSDALWKISLGQYPFEQTHTLVTGDSVEGNLNPKLKGVSEEQLVTDLRKLVSERKITEALDIAQELRVRSDLTLNSSDRIDARQGILTLHEFLRTGTRQGRQADGTPGETKISAEDRLKFHGAIIGDLDGMVKQIDSRNTLSTLLLAAGRHKDAETALLEAQKLADELPLEVILEQRKQIKRDAAVSTSAEAKAWLETAEKALGDPTESDPTKMGGVLNQPVYTRLRLMQFYMGYDDSSTHVGEVIKPERAAEVAEDLRNMAIKKLGFDPLKSVEATVVPPPPGSAVETASPPSSTKIDPPTELAKKLREVEEMHKETNVKALRERIKKEPDNKDLKVLLEKVEAPIENLTTG